MKYIQIPQALELIQHYWMSMCVTQEHLRMPMWCGREGEEGCLCAVVGRGRRDAYVLW